MSESVHPDPIGPVTLPAAPERSVPVPDDLSSELSHRPHVGRDCVVREVAAHHPGQPCALLWDWQMPSSLQLAFQLAQLRLHPLPHRLPLQEKLPRLRPAADVRQAEVVEGLRLPESLRLPSRGSVPAELDQARLLGVQLQREFPESIPEALEESLGIRLVLEANNEVIRPAGDDDVSPRVLLPPLLDPQVEGVRRLIEIT